MPSVHHPQRNLMFAIVVLSCFFILHAIIVQNITQQTASERVPQSKFEKLPDFAAISDTKARKAAFFDFLRPLVEAENQRLQGLRESLPKLSDSELKKLAESYKISDEIATADLPGALRKHIDTIPVSLVLAQAAIESAWGTSRFARKGNNLFGEWCFTKGCGLVPQSRNSEAKHEVRRFASAADSIRSYMKNLNTHRAYRSLRAQRFQQQQLQQAYSGCFLAKGLTSYSQKGDAYVEMVKSLIRHNRLETASSGYCKPVVIAKPEQANQQQSDALVDAKEPHTGAGSNLPEELPAKKTDTARDDSNDPPTTPEESDDAA